MILGKTRAFSEERVKEIYIVELLLKKANGLGPTTGPMSNGFHLGPAYCPGTVTSLVSRGCKITASSRVLFVRLGFRATRCTAPEGS